MNTKKASDLPPRLLRRMLADTERTAGPDSQSAAALRRALVEAKRRAAKRPDGEIRFDMEKLLRFLNRSEKGAGRGGNAIARQARQAAGAACSDARILLARPPLHK